MQSSSEFTAIGEVIDDAAYRINQKSFEIIAGCMLEFNPLLGEALDHANKT